MKFYINILMISVTSMISLVVSGQQKFNGTFSNGYKGGKLSFVLSADKKWIKDFTFSGHWRCGGSTESITAGPERSFPVKNGQVDAVITEPENGGSSAFRFSLKGMVKGNAANGSFRMSITGLSCDTYLLNWTANAR